MDSESGLLSDVKSRGLELLDKSKGSFQLTNLPITEGAEESPSLDSIFQRRVIVRAISLKLLPTSSTTPSGTAEKPTPVKVILAVLVKTPGDAQFSPVLEEGSQQEKVRDHLVMIKNAGSKSPSPEMENVSRLCIQAPLFKLRLFFLYNSDLPSQP